MTKSPKEAPAPPAASDLITPDQLATRLQVSVGTIYNRIGHWGVDDGVVRLGPRCTRINWPVFWQRLLDGKIVFRSKD
jgi:hypothetical protein